MGYNDISKQKRKKEKIREKRKGNKLLKDKWKVLPKSSNSITLKYDTACGNLYLILCFDNDFDLLAIIPSLGKSGCCAHSQLEGITRAISMGLQYGVPPEKYVEQLKDIKCPSRVSGEDGCFSCADAISIAINKFLKIKTVIKSNDLNNK